MKTGNNDEDSKSLPSSDLLAPAHTHIVTSNRRKMQHKRAHRLLDTAVPATIDTGVEKTPKQLAHSDMYDTIHVGYTNHGVRNSTSRITSTESTCTSHPYAELDDLIWNDQHGTQDTPQKQSMQTIANNTMPYASNDQKNSVQKHIPGDNNGKFAQFSYAYDRLDPKPETDKFPSEKILQNVTTSKSSHEEIDKRVSKRTEMPIATHTSEIYMHSKGSFYERIVSKRRKAHSFSSPSSCDTRQIHRSLSTTLPNTNQIGPNAKKHVYKTIDDFKMFNKHNHSAESSEEQATTSSAICNKINNTGTGVHFFYQRTLECGNAGLDHTIHGHNITIRIPEGAVPPGEKLHIQVGVTMFGPFIFPDNFSPISAILQLCPSDTQTDYRFQKPFTVILPHFLSENTIEKLNPGEVRFAKARHHNTGQERRQSYKFEFIDTKPIAKFASSGSRNLSVLDIQHCCYLCIMKGRMLKEPSIA